MSLRLMPDGQGAGTPVAIDTAAIALAQQAAVDAQASAQAAIDAANVQGASNRRLRTLMALQASIARAGGRIPGLMASPPAIGASTAATAIASPTHWQAPANPSLYSFMGGTWAPAGLTWPTSTAMACVSFHNGDGTNPAANPGQADGARVRFVLDAPAFEIYVLYGDAFGGFRLKIDGEYAFLGLKGNSTEGPANGDPRYIPIQFGDGSATYRKARHYELEFSASGRFGGVVTSALYKPRPWPSPDGLRALVHGDSMINVVSDPGAYVAYPHGPTGNLLGTLLGQPDCISSSVGSTGWTTNGTGFSRFNDRVTLDVVNQSPDIIIEMGGKNDQGTGVQATVQALVYSWLSTVIAAKPETVIFMTGPMLSRGVEAAAGFIEVRNAKMAAAAMFPKNVAFIDNVAAGWVTGSGRTGAPANDGNADWVNGTDNTHPSRPGHGFVADHITKAIAAAIPSLMAVQ